MFEKRLEGVKYSPKWVLDLEILKDQNKIKIIDDFLYKHWREQYPEIYYLDLYNKILYSGEINNIEKRAIFLPKEKTIIQEVKYNGIVMDDYVQSTNINNIKSQHSEERHYFRQNLGANYEDTVTQEKNLFKSLEASRKQFFDDKRHNKLHSLSSKECVLCKQITNEYYYEIDDKMVVCPCDNSKYTINVFKAIQEYMKRK